ncbi:MAG: antitoxin MazE family protein [Alphaproteobacteria bacterium]|nr:antitoxin MazE family protein [Alphaproteobacteria bacterium]
MPSHSKSRPPPASSATKVRAHRLRLRAMGLRPIQLWVPDTRSSAFAAEAKRQSSLIAGSDAQDQAFIDALSDLSFK